MAANFPGATNAIPWCDPIIKPNIPDNPIDPKVGDFVKSRKHCKKSKYFQIRKVLRIKKDGDVVSAAVKCSSENGSISLGFRQHESRDWFVSNYVHATKKDLVGIKDVAEPEPGSVKVDQFTCWIQSDCTSLNINGENILRKHFQIKDMLLEGMIWVDNKENLVQIKELHAKGLIFKEIGAMHMPGWELKLGGIDDYEHKWYDDFLKEFEPLFKPGNKLLYQAPLVTKFGKQEGECLWIDYKGPDDITIRVHDFNSDYSQKELLSLTVANGLFDLQRSDCKDDREIIANSNGWDKNKNISPKAGETWEKGGAINCTDYDVKINIISVVPDSHVVAQLAGPAKFDKLPWRTVDISLGWLNNDWEFCDNSPWKRRTFDQY